MTVDRRIVADTLFTAAVMGIGFATGVPAVTAIVGGIGVNIAADLIQAGWGRVCPRLLGQTGLLNHDLQAALARALHQAIGRLETAWWRGGPGARMRRQGEAEPVEALFRDLRHDAMDFCSPDGLGRAAGNVQVQQLLYGDEAAVRRELAEKLKSYLYGHDPQLVAFLQNNLVPELAFCFGEQLKADNPEGNRAWRAFQRLLLEGLQAGIVEVQAELVGMHAAQQEIQRVLAELLDWARRLDATPPEVREPTGQAGLEQALADLSRQMEAGFVAVREDLAGLPERIRPILREELGVVRPPAGPPVPPPALTLFGRDRFLADLAADLTQYAVRHTLALTALRGLPGVGKTALALALINRDDVAAAFPDGRVWLPLGPKPDVFGLLGRALEQFGSTAQDLLTVEARADRLRGVLAGKRCLLALDDVWEADHARPFLDACRPPARAIFTTRKPQLAADLHAANHEVRVLQPKYAVRMLAAAGEHAAAAVAADEAGASELAEALGRLPLALHVAGRRLERLARADGPRDAVARLRRELDRRLLMLPAAGRRPGLEEAEPSLEAILALSYDALPDDATRAAFRRLGVFGGQPLDFDAGAMAAVWEADDEAAADLRIALTDAGLLERAEQGENGEEESRSREGRHGTPSAIRHSPFAIRHSPFATRYALHQVIAAFAAARLAADPAEEAAAYLAHAQHYAARAESLNDANLSDDPAEHLDDLAFLAQMDLDFPQISRAVAWVQDNPVAWPALRVLTGSCRNYALAFRSLIAEYQAWSQAALQIAEAIQDRAWAANARKALGDLALRQDDLAGAGEQYRAALADFQAIGARLGAANARKALGDLALRQDDLAGAGEQYRAALADFQAIGDRLGAANARLALGDLALRQDDLAGAGEQYRAALADFQAIGARLGAANARLALGDLALRQDDLAGAGEQYRAALADFQAIGARLGAANSYFGLGELARQASSYREAADWYQRALDLYRSIGARLGQANVLDSMGELAEAQEQWQTARDFFIAALQIYHAIGDPYARVTARKLARIEARLTGAIQGADRSADILRQWEPIIAATVAAAQGDAQATAGLTPILDSLAATADWGNLIAALRRVLAGERAFPALAEGLDATDRLILGTTLRRLCVATQDWPGAAAAAEALIALGAGDAETWEALADARANQGDEAGAAEAYAQAVALAPDQAMLRRNYANTLIALGRLEEAGAQLDAAEALEPDAPYLALRRAELAKARDDREAARRWAEEALRRRPDWDEAQAVLDWARG